MAMLMHTEAYKLAGGVDKLTRRCSCFCSNQTDKNVALGYMRDQLGLVAAKIKELQKDGAESDTVPETPESQLPQHLKDDPYLVSTNPLIRGFKRKKGMKGFKKDEMVAAVLKFDSLYPLHGLSVRCSNSVPFPSRIASMAVIVVSE